MTSSVLKHQHTSMQFSDNREQQRHDVEKLFRLGKNFPIKTGTESGNDNALGDLIPEFAKRYNHVLSRAEGNWVAVDKSIIKPGSVKADHVFVADSARLSGPQRDRVFPWIQFTHSDPRMGRFAVAGFHYSTNGKNPSQPNWDTNKEYAEEIAKWMRKMARGTQVALGAGDFNLIDTLESQDWAFGGPFTSMADELGKHPVTTHDKAPIDGFVSFDKDGRVKAKKFEVLDDSEMQMFMDHYVCRGTWTVRHLKTK